jgi:hypothetical protein
MDVELTLGDQGLNCSRARLVMASVCRNSARIAAATYPTARASAEPFPSLARVDGLFSAALLVIGAAVAKHVPAQLEKSLRLQELAVRD